VQAYLEDSHARNFRASMNDVGWVESILRYRGAKANHFNAVKKNCILNFLYFLFQVCCFKFEEYKHFQTRTKKMDSVSWLRYTDILQTWRSERLDGPSKNEDFCADQQRRLYSTGNDLYVALQLVSFYDETLIFPNYL